MRGNTMLKKFIFLYFITIYLLLFSFNLRGITFECENGYSYKIDFTDKKSLISFKKINESWQKVENNNLNKNKLELFLPNSKYLSCSDKSLPQCEYSTLIIYKQDVNQASVREVIINDCFIGTMGCNKYNKGLELNQRRCNVRD